MPRGAASEITGAATKAAAKMTGIMDRKALSSEARAGFLGNLGDDLASEGALLSMLLIPGQPLIVE